MFEGSQLFWYKLVFMTELLIAETLFVARLKRRRYFWLRAALSLVVCYAAAFLFPLLVFNAWYASLMFLLLFAVTALLLKFCLDEPLVNIVFCAVAAYSVQHIAFQFYNMIINATGLNDGAPLGIYDETSEPYYTFSTGLIYVMSYSFVYWLTFLCFANRIKKDADVRVRNVSLFLIVAVVVFVDIVLNAVATYRSYESYDVVLTVIVEICIIINCALSLSIQFGLMSQKSLETELDKVYHLWRQEQKQFAASKANIDLINMKCHDLKHQIRRIGSTGAMNETALREIENTISIYDSAVKTGNAALDVILTEKSLLCSQNDICLTCVVDGGRLDFMGEVDLYTLFGNAIDNAVEAVMQLPAEKRVISITTKETGDLFSVNIRNFYGGEVKFEGGLPVTTKADKNYHGFGMKSIKMMAEKYGGDVSVVTKDDVFNLNVLFSVET